MSDNNLPTVRVFGDDHPALAVDAIGGEPVGVMTGDCHVRLHTWHGIAEPFDVDNSQALYLTASDAYLLAETLMAAADRLAFKLEEQTND